MKKWEKNIFTYMSAVNVVHNNIFLITVIAQTVVTTTEVTAIVTAIIYLTKNIVKNVIIHAVKIINIKIKAMHALTAIKMMMNKHLGG
ncbi:hypothetical protein [Anoxybacillus sp. ST4]|uniref:hypothetical protein n=1 Tax=Anoxybacillus sp. ST4 TaxID=2864181 RepID=UPI001C643492|nr:hypothetical protein [Anoxybacillus sp. ST4]MBW7651202.1 hypothetical protein [Anoxybacillus sp. ST4]